MGILAGGVNLYFIYKFLRILTTKWEDTDAFKLGIIDEKGKILKKHSTLKSSDEKDAYTLMHRLVWKLKRLLNKIPGGKSKLASYAAALWLIKEEREFTGTNEELQESFLTFLESDWKNDALILKETYEGDMNKTTYTTLMTNMSEAGDKEAYQAFFKATLKKFGVTEPDQLEGDKKKKFFDAIDKGWKGDNEKPEPGDKKEEVEIDESFIDDIVDTFKSILRIPKNVALITKSILNGNVKDMESLSSNLSDKQRDKMIKMFSDQLKDGKYKKQGKINIIKLLATLKHDSLKEEVEIEEKKSATGYELYHKTFSDAMQHAYAHAKKKGFVVDPKEIDDKVATGPKKPSSGKTNRYSLKAGRKTVEIQVANLDNKRYELNMYIEEVEIGKGLKKFKETLKDLTTEKVKRLEKEGAAEFMAAASAAKKAGKKKFTFGGKEHPVTIKTHIPLAKEEVDLYIQHVSGFDSFITEGRPALDPNYIHPANGVPDTERRRLVQSQQKRYKLSDIESIARKHKVKLELSKYSANQPIQFDDEWTLYTNKGIGLIYDYQSNDTTISGWKIDKNKLRQYKDKYESQDATMNSLHVRKGRVTVSGFESAFELIGESLKEDAPVNATGVNVVGTGDDPTVWKKKKKKTIKTEEFGGKKVFVVSPQKYWDSRLGKSRYSRYEKYVGNDAIGEAIREYGLSNPKAPIILKNSKTGAMLYLKYGKPNVE
jgi:hypothetical protein